MTPLDTQLAAELETLRAGDLYRRRRVVDGAHATEAVVDGRRCTGFCSNDYLGLASDTRVARAARRALGESGTGSGAATLVSGYNRWHRRLEEALAQFTGRPRVLLFSSGWAANLGALRAVLSKRDTLIADELNHASLIDGGHLSKARYVRVPHRGLAAFALALDRAAGQGRTLVATDAVFSMDGDLAPLPGLADLCARHGAALMVDDAHGFCVLGDRGRGALERVPSPDIYMATLGKALGVAGAFIAGSETLIEYLVQRARTWVFSTAPPPALAAAALESLRIVESEPERRARLFGNIRRLRDGAAESGISFGSHSALEGSALVPILPLVLGDERRALHLSRFLFERGLWVTAIRPPTVPDGTARLRITLSAAHTAAQIDRLLDALNEGLRELSRLDAAA